MLVSRKLNFKVVLAAALAAGGGLMLSAGALRAGVVLEADFSGSGTGTGNPNNVVATGGTGILKHAGGNTITISSTSPFSSGSGGYMYATTNSSASSGYSQTIITPTSDANSPNSWVSGNSVNGALDFFFRASQNSKTWQNDVLNPFGYGYYNQPSPGTLYVSLTNTGAGNGQMTLLMTEGNTPESGWTIYKAATSSSSYLSANQVYHVAGTITTNSITGALTMNVYVAQGTGAITPADSSTYLYTGSTTFTLHDPTLATNPFFDAFGLTSTVFEQSAVPSINIGLDTLRLYNDVPTTFAGSAVVPEPTALGLLAAGGLGLLLVGRKRKLA